LLSEFTLASTAVREITTVSAASFIGDELAQGQIATAFGEGLVAQAETATFLPLPVELGGAKVLVTDSAGVARPAPLFFTSPSQINFLVPVETALGTATIKVIGTDGAVSVGVISVFVGLDQINLRLPRALAGSGDVGKEGTAGFPRRYGSTRIVCHNS
jgi:hypothetical protein